jgi:hypothetical protein
MPACAFSSVQVQSSERRSLENEEKAASDGYAYAPLMAGLCFDSRKTHGFVNQQATPAILLTVNYDYRRF